ncbi:hypothetical protein [Streptomyces sp. NBC_01334]|uniref:hypothetical protein n=1 Tax=Streptomyces sp. NBC_01334 TaxID=2903827 RepID=UPI002E14E24A|nr:hypothetical protein OG736_03760 [Streptomyces sp. NBC_01334]
MTSHRIGGRVLALTAGTALGLGTLAVALPVAGSRPAPLVALAADAVSPAVTLGADTVRAGGEVSFTVAGFPAGGTLSVKLDDATLLEQFTIVDDGTVTGAVTVPAGTSAGAGHWLRFLAPQTSVRSADLTVTTASSSPSPSPDPTAEPAVRLTGGASVTAGDKVAFGLSGFVEGQTVTVKLDDTSILTRFGQAVAADGTFSGSVTIPASTSAGAHWLRFLAPDPATSLKADLKVTAAAGSGGATGGSGTGGSGGTDSGSGGSAATGGTGSTGGTGPTGGSASGGGSGSSGSSSPSVSLTAGTRVAAGGKVSFRVTGFPAGQQLTVKLDDAEIIGQWQGGIGSDGAFSGTVTVPSDAPAGAHWLRFLAPNPATSLKASFTVTSSSASATASAGDDDGTTGASATPVPAASGEPVSATNSAGAKAGITAGRVQAGGTLHFEVTKFPAGETVTVKLDDQDILGQWKADAQGSYEGDVTVPADTADGAHWLRFLAPNPPTSLKVAFTVTGAAGTGSASSSSTTAPGPTEERTLAAAASVQAPVSYATIAWSAAAAAAGGAAGAAATTLFVVRRRPAAAGSGD